MNAITYGKVEHATFSAARMQTQAYLYMYYFILNQAFIKTSLQQNSPSCRFNL